MTITLTIANQKGGVGKTSTVYHLARAAILADMRVLAIDLDQQGNLTTFLAGESASTGQASVADVLTQAVPVDQAIVSGLWDGLDLLPVTSGEALAATRHQLTSDPGGNHKLAEALATVAGRYDLILIDTAPAIDALTFNALVAASQVLVVTQSSELALAGISPLFETIAKMRKYFNPALAVTGFLPSLHEQQTLSGKHYLEALAENAAEIDVPVLAPIPRSAAVRDSAQTRHGLDEWASPNAQDLTNLYASHLTAILNH